MNAASNDPVLDAITKLGESLRQEMRETRNGLVNQIGDLAERVDEIKSVADEAFSTSSMLNRQINGSGQPPPPTGGVYINGAISGQLSDLTDEEKAKLKEAAQRPMVSRITGAEGGLTDVIGQVGKLQEQVDTLTKLNVAQNRAQGIADAAEGLAKKAWTFGKSREGAKFAVQMGILIAMAYGAFQAKLAADRYEARPPALVAPAR